MVRDAELNAAEDQKKVELVQARNLADARVHEIRKSLGEHGAKLEASEKEAIETALKDVEDAIKTDDKAAIEAKTEALMTASQKLGEKMYAEQAQAAAASGAGGAGGPQEPHFEQAQAPAADDNVVDADFKEVKKS